MNYNYLKILKQKEIKVVPLEEYKGTQTKILHKCTCGNEWNVVPITVCKGGKCGCNKIKTKSNDWYLAKLKEKEIKVIPLEKYKSNLIKILHKCICGNEWLISPNNVLTNHKCGCIIIASKSNDWYLSKLKEKEIKVIPLEKYINSKTKILHKCTCGNEWKVTPGNILKLSKCGCIKVDLTKSNKWYINKLKEKEIKVKPLEEYINSKTPIKHKCYCENEWLVPPMRVLNGSGCGCKKNYETRGVDFYKDKETVLYHIKLTLEDKVLYKVGVTLFKNSIEKSIRNRFGKEFDFMKILETKIFQDGSEAFILEQKIINENWKHKYNGEKVLRSGNTELFTEDIKEIQENYGEYFI